MPITTTDDYIEFAKSDDSLAISRVSVLSVYMREIVEAFSEPAYRDISDAERLAIIKRLAERASQIDDSLVGGAK